MLYYIIGDYMKLEDLEKYRDENGFIDMDLALKENVCETINEGRGSQNRDKFWIVLDDTEVLLRNDNLDDCGVEYTGYAELLMEELSKQVGINSAHYDIVKYNGKNGVISKNVLDKTKNESMHTIKSISGVDMYPNEPIDIISIWNGVKNFTDLENGMGKGISKEKLQEVYNDVGKTAIFDIFTMSNDRHSENIGIVYGKNDEDNELIFKLASLYDNECSLMLDKPVDEIDEMLNDEQYLERMVDLQEQMITVPEDMKGNVQGWKDMLYFLTDEFDEFMDFAEECYNKLDIKSAIDRVESRISSKLPDKLKEFVTKSFEIRRDSIDKALILSIDDMEVER